MHARLGCASCQAKLRKAQQARQAMRSPTRGDRSPSPCCDHVPPPPEPELGKDGLPERGWARGRERPSSAAVPVATSSLEPPRPRFLSAIAPPSNAANRASSRERRRARRQQEVSSTPRKTAGQCASTPSKPASQAARRGMPMTCKSEASLKLPHSAWADSSSQATHEEEPNPELSPDMPMRQLPEDALSRSYSAATSVDHPDFRHMVCENFINSVKASRSLERWETLPSWTEVFAKCGSRWEPEVPPEAATPRSPMQSARSAPSEMHSAKADEPGPMFGRKFLNVEECLQYLRTPRPLHQRSLNPRQFTTVEECMEFLKTPPEFPSKMRPTGSSREDIVDAKAGEAQVSDSTEQEEALRRAADTALRGEEAAREAARILALRRENFQSQVDWAFAVLDAAEEGSTRDPATVQRCFRGLMRKMHPDRVDQSSDIAQAVEILREAKDVSQRHVSEVERPGPPRAFQAATLCAVPGRRRIRLQWSPPEDQKSAPIRRYVVRVVDPVCGRALKIAVLEPDYLEEIRRFVSVEELGSYILAEEELHKIPGLWKESHATVQVAAANEAGESPWAVFKVPLNTKPALPLAVPTAGIQQQSPIRSSERNSVHAAHVQSPVVRTAR